MPVTGSTGANAGLRAAPDSVDLQYLRKRRLEMDAAFEADETTPVPE